MGAVVNTSFGAVAHAAQLGGRCVSSGESWLASARNLACTAESAGKVEFMVSAMQQSHPFACVADTLDNELLDVVAWIASQSAGEARAERERIVANIEARDRELRASGAARDWLARGDSCAQAISADVNGPLLEHLADLTGFCDESAIDMLRFGGPVVGTLPVSGHGRQHVFASADDLSTLRGQCLGRNRALLASLHTDPHCEELVRMISGDADLGRMTCPCDISNVDLESCLLARRFSVEQGLRNDGSVKLRAVDDESANGTNGCCEPTERLYCDRLDKFVALIRAFYTATHSRPSLWKADIDSAFRRVPVLPEHRWLLWVVVATSSGIFAARHNALPFGCTGSVHCWNRIGALLAHVAVVCLRIPILRYVDDFFSLDRHENVAHSLACFARVVRCLLGSSALSDEKMGFGPSLEVLGVVVSFSRDGIALWPSERKVEKWLRDIDRALLVGRLSAGDASKLAGRLSFASQVIFKRFGRAMLRPLFAQQYAPLRGGRLGPLLVLALRWWRAVLSLHLCEHVPLTPRPVEVCELFTDARGTPPRVAAVLATSERLCFSDWMPSEDVLANFVERRDAQIMGLELLAVVFGLCTFLDDVRGKYVRIYIDNTGGESALEKGAARSADHNLLVHSVWHLGARYGFGIWIERVPSSLNIADEPSRECYGTLWDLGASWVEPKLRRELRQPTAWIKSIADCS